MRRKKRGKVRGGKRGNEMRANGVDEGGRKLMRKKYEKKS